jgi:stage II sporulation protein D
MGGSALTVVDELPLEDYVKGVAPAEVPKSFHPEAQKALIVAIRTYALRSLKRHEAVGYNLCDGIHCQGFAGASRESSWIDKIVEETKGQIITYKGEPIYAVYSSDCGGATQNNEDGGVGREPWPYLRSVVDNQSSVVSCQLSVNPKYEDYCVGSQYHTWSRTFAPEELGRVFSKWRSTGKIGKFQSMEFTEYDCSGRVKTIKLTGDKGACSITGTQFRDMLGLSVIMSTRMTLKLSPDGKYVIDGKGYGHGIGLCAFGANGLAKSDKKITYVDILKHYYTGIEIKTLGKDSRP